MIRTVKCSLCKVETFEHSSSRYVSYMLPDWLNSWRFCGSCVEPLNIYKAGWKYGAAIWLPLMLENI